MATPIQGGVQPPITPGVRTDQVQQKASAQLKVSIVQASVEVSINARNEPQQLLFSNVIANLNEMLKPQLGENAIQNAVNQDNTPEGTAQRIVSLSTNLLDAFKAQHPGEDPNTVLTHFMDTIKKGIDQGFKEARGILDSLGVLQGDIAGNIDKTYDLVQQKLNDFQTKMQGTPTAPQG